MLILIKLSLSFKNIYSLIWLCQVLLVACRIFSCSTWTLSYYLWDLVPWPGIKPGSPAVRVRILSHWTTREVLMVSLNLAVNYWPPTKHLKTTKNQLLPHILYYYYYYYYCLMLSHVAAVGQEFGHCLLDDSILWCLLRLQWGFQEAVQGFTGISGTGRGLKSAICRLDLGWRNHVWDDAFMQPLAGSLSSWPRGTLQKTDWASIQHGGCPSP